VILVILIQTNQLLFSILKYKHLSEEEEKIEEKNKKSFPRMLQLNAELKK